MSTTTWTIMMHPSGYIAGAGATTAQARDRAQAVRRRHIGDDVDEDGLSAWMSTLVEGSLVLKSPVTLDDQIEEVIPASLAIIGEEDICRRCGCRDHRPCPQGCGWVEDLFCSACAEACEAMGGEIVVLG